MLENIHLCVTPLDYIMSRFIIIHQTCITYTQCNHSIPKKRFTIIGEHEMCLVKNTITMVLTKGNTEFNKQNKLSKHINEHQC